MRLWVALGGAVGALIGILNGGILAVVGSAALGAAGVWLIGRSTSAAAADASDPMLARLDALDARLTRIETRLALQETALTSVQEVSPIPAPVVPAPAVDLSTPPAPATAVDLSPPPAPAMASAQTEPPPRPSYQVGSAISPRPSTPARSEAPPPVPKAAEPSAISSPMLRWITGGNALTRVGIVILFFGVAFLLRYFAEIVTVPIELKLAAAGAGGLVLAAIGFTLAKRRPAYGLSLQGAGMGIVYLTVFAAFRLYEVLSPLPAIALLVVGSGATIALAWRHDSQPLAALALAGGFLAPILIRTGSANPALLLGYFAVLNAVVFALAWKRAWRPLNVLGFVFTFVLGLVWGYGFYTPAHYAIVQPYLALFFAFYIGIATLYARQDPLNARAPVDGILVFGVPIVGFALQMAIVRSHRYGVAWSAVALAAIYGTLWWWLRARANPGWALLAKAFAVLAVMFATLAIPFAVDSRATSAWWALEAAAVYWLGVVQRQPLARAFAVLLQLGAALVFVIDAGSAQGMLLLNARALGMALIGAAAFASTWAADRYPDRIAARERTFLSLWFGWGVAWWIMAGVVELYAKLATPVHIDAALAWVVGNSLLALVLGRALRWPRIAWLAVALLPAMLLAGVADLSATRTTLTHFGWIVWPLAWVVAWATLRTLERVFVTHPERDDALRIAHAVCAIGWVAWSSWELSEWAGRRTPDGSVWVACGAALPAILYLLATVHWRGSQRWPLLPHRDAYGASAGTTIAALLFVWFVIVNVVSSGDPSPLPYVPLLNPLDLTLIGALGALAAWDRDWGRHPQRVRYAWLGAAAFLALNGVILRIAHHWGDVPWNLDALMASKSAQVALTLTWTVTALALMLWATRHSVRVLWMVGAALLAVVVVKLFAIDLGSLSGLTRVVAFMGVGLLLLVIGFVTPLPPAARGTTLESAGG